MTAHSHSLDHPERYGDIRAVIQRKLGLKALYTDFYTRLKESLQGCPTDGKVVEVGSGAGFLKEVIPEVVTSDILPYPGVEMVVDATQMPFEERSLKAILMLNAFHHIPEVGRLFSEASRCLRPGGKLIIVDQYPGWISLPILKLLHHEPFDANSTNWNFPSTGPLSGANGALPWIVFFRDRTEFERRFPTLQIVRCETHTPLRYWLSGGLKKWTLLPSALFRAATVLDSLLIRLSPEFGSFVHVELQKKEGPS